MKNIRWKQRFENFEKALQQLEQGVLQKNLNTLEEQGLIQSFEFTFELAWKTLKDFLESQEVDASFPREVVKQAFHYGIIQNGEVWMDMLEKRNILTHTYNEQYARLAVKKIKNEYFQAIKQAHQYLLEKNQ